MTIRVLLLIAVLPGCASHRYTVDEPVQTKFGTYSSVEVADFSSNVAGEQAQRLAGALPERIVRTLSEAKAASGAPLFATVSRSDETRQSLRISGRILSFEEGSRAKRYLLGFGAGKAYTTVECRFADERTGETIATATFDGELSMGIFGGSSDEAVDGMLKSIVEYVNDNY